MYLISLCEGEERWAHRRAVQPPAHPCLAERAATTEAQAQGEGVVGGVAASGRDVPVQQIRLEKPIGVRLNRFGVRAPPQGTEGCDCAKRRRDHVAGLLDDPRCVTRHEPHDPRHRVESHGTDLAPEAPSPGSLSIADEPGRAVEHLTESDSSHGRVDEVVERGLIGLPEVLPGATAERGERRRFPEVQSVGAPRREVVVALVRVADLIDGEIIEVPFPTPLHVDPPGLRCDLRGVLSANQIGELVGDVDVRGPQERVAESSGRAAWASGRTIAGWGSLRLSRFKGRQRRLLQTCDVRPRLRQDDTRTADQEDDERERKDAGRRQRHVCSRGATFTMARAGSKRIPSRNASKVMVRRFAERVPPQQTGGRDSVDRENTGSETPESVAPAPTPRRDSIIS